VSSYAPSLSALLRARKGFEPIPTHDLKALLIAESQSPGFTRLTKVEGEVHHIASMVRSASATVLNDLHETSTVQLVTGALPDAHILHLACHGRQTSDPLTSHFALRDGPLSIDTLMRLNLPHAAFAFLSACETAKGDKNQPDQVVHLAASLLFCGFRSIIATMWYVGNHKRCIQRKRLHFHLGLWEIWMDHSLRRRFTESYFAGQR
jgi:CHAT domain-containing protein